jgi:hypothetical protein
MRNFIIHHNDNDGRLAAFLMAQDIREKKHEASEFIEADYRSEIEQTIEASQTSGQMEYTRRVAVDVRVSADASVGGQTLSQATLDQIVVKITPAVTRAVLDELRVNQSAAGY